LVLSLDSFQLFLYSLFCICQIIVPAWAELCLLYNVKWISIYYDSSCGFNSLRWQNVFLY